MLSIEKNTIHIGLERKLKVLHITDSHIPFCCDTDSEAMHRSGLHSQVVGDMAEPYPSTRAFYEYVTGEPLIKAVLAGHLHFGFESVPPGGKMQYVTALGSEGNTREFTVT